MAHWELSRQKQKKKQAVIRKRKTREFVKLEINTGHLTLEQSVCKGKTKKERPLMGNFHPAWSNNKFHYNAVNRLQSRYICD